MKTTKAHPLWAPIVLVCATLVGCAELQTASKPDAYDKPSVPENLGPYAVLTYGLPFVYEEGQPRQEAFLYVIRENIAPADWENGPDSMTPIAHILVVSTTAENHMRLKRFFVSLPDRPEGYQETWREMVSDDESEASQ